MRQEYSNTELGEIPDNWIVAKWEDVCEICYGKDQKQVEDSNGMYPIYGTGGIMSYSNSYLSSDPSVLIGRKGTIDKPIYIDKPFWTVDTLFYTRMKEDISVKWFYYLVCLTPLKKYNEATGVPSLSRGNLYNIKVAVPPLPEQQKIATILSTVDEKIEIIGEQITQTRELKKGLMQKLLKRGIGHTKFKDSVLGEVPESWEVIKLGMVVDFFNGKGHEQCINENGDYIVVNSKFVSTDGKVKKYSDQNLCPLQENDIAMVMSDVPNGKAIAKCFIVTENDKYTLNQRICCLRTTKGDYKFLYYVINRNEYYLSMDNGVSQTNFRKEEVLNCPIPFVPFAEQKQIAWILTTVDDKLEVLHKKKESYQELKKGLMQQLLTGKVRVFQTELEIS